MRPNRFVLNTDYGSMKNDNHLSVSLTIPASQSIASAAAYITTADLTIGVKGGITKYLIEHPLQPGRWFATGQAAMYLEASSPAGASYILRLYMTRLNATTVRATAYIHNNLAPATAMVTEATERVVNFKVYTFIPPFA